MNMVAFGFKGLQIYKCELDLAFKFKYNKGAPSSPKPRAVFQPDLYCIRNVNLVETDTLKISEQTQLCVNISLLVSIV